MAPMNCLSIARAVICVTVLLSAALAAAQDNYEIQVYGSSTVAKGHTMFELHSNYTFLGSTTMSGKMYPT
jgi:hypothetical protein